MVVTGLEIIKDVFNFAVSVNQEADAVNPVVGFPHEGFLTPDAKLFADLVIFIGEQGEVQQLFFREAGEFFRFIGADTQNLNAGFFQLVHIIAKAACLHGAARGHRFRVKIDQNTLSLEVGQIYLLAVLIGQTKFRCDITGFQWVHYSAPSCSSCCE